MEIKLFDSELKVMDVLWRQGDVTAKEIAAQLKEAVGWNVNTTYTVIKKCIAKQAVRRREPNFMCHALISKEDVQQAETTQLIDKLFDGAPELLFASLLGQKKLSAEKLSQLRQLVEQADADTRQEK